MEQGPYWEADGSSAVQERQRFNIMLTRVCHWILSWARWTHSTISCLIPLKFILILSSNLYLDLPNGPFLQVYWQQFCTHSSSSSCQVLSQVTCYDLYSSHLRGCIHKFPDWVDNEIYAYNNKHSLRSNIKGYGGKTH
jgi:hypothetical protein